MNKNLKLLAVLALFILSIMPVAKAADDIDLNNVKVYNLDIDEYDNLSPMWNSGQIPLGPFYAGDKLHLRVFWAADSLGLNTDSSVDVKINVEFDDQDMETDYFTVKPGWMDSSSFIFDIDEDIDVGVHTLTIELEDETGAKIVYDKLKLNVVNQKHDVKIYDVNFPQGLEVKAGQTFLTSVGVKNLGDEKEEDVKVSVSVPQLGLYQRSNLFDLYTEADYDKNDDNDWKLHKDLFLVVPSNTVSGVYEMIVKVDYDDGDHSQEYKYSLVVGEGVAPGSELISIDTTTQTFAQGSGAVYTIMFSEPKAYTIKVDGVSDWGTYMVNMNDDQAFVFVSAKEDANSGNYPFTVKVMAGSATVKEFDLTANVTRLSQSSDIKEGLQIGFAVLLIILIILGIILAAKKIGGSDEEPLMDEGETYY